MKVMTATEASRNFAAVLDMAEHGETVIVTRGGRRLAMISQAPAGNGADLADLLDRFAGTLDDDFEDDVMGTRSLLTAEDPWSE
ncbi:MULTISPECIES: type II toxin-antitoxin system prevent-host-death family antitoxin [unclassified Streptomyces]|uniref:type II toxin-antitoxin system Phd/YefM family antitoxin n=1 Tax=unclassified Streptomyces TaxID=2593676 RepID=UPI00081EF28C|nr:MULTISPECIES: type II toxin-antitoxin system prevent-host-death family antitoxin [unclassified Streptomyces]MYZ38484.1 type II toxin-antitoxin system prevent-host-death family antitoxin [Streptomyces sp. SID4917]SCF98737.1 prevent-host-death family protein [Streptomyces sp. MnatMP-M17]